MYPCFLAGVLLNRQLAYFEKNLKLIFIASGICFMTMYLTANALYDFICLNGFELLAKIVRRFYNLIMGLSGALFVIALFDLLSQRLPSTKAGSTICNWGKYTLGIYILQTFVLEIFLRDHFNCDAYGFMAFNFIIAPLIAIGVLLLSLLCIRLIHRSAWCSFFLLGEALPKTPVK